MGASQCPGRRCVPGGKRGWCSRSPRVTRVRLYFPCPMHQTGSGEDVPKNHSVVVIEDLKLKNLTRSARGTMDEPGRNVAQKAGLNRAMLDVAPGRLATMLGYKTARRGGLLIRVPAAYSSQECAECGHVSSENRPSRSEFCCVSCGHEAHADTNAAKVLLQRYTRRTGGEAACGGTLEAGPMKQEPKPARARTKATKTRAKSLGLQASSLPKTIDPP